MKTSEIHFQLRKWLVFSRERAVHVTVDLLPVGIFTKMTMLVFMEKLMKMSTKKLLMNKNTVKRTSRLTRRKEVEDKLLSFQDPPALSLPGRECTARMDHPEFEQSADSAYLGDFIFGYAL